MQGITRACPYGRYIAVKDKVNLFAFFYVLCVDLGYPMCFAGFTRRNERNSKDDNMTKLEKYEDFMEALRAATIGDKGVCEALNSDTLISLTHTTNGFKIGVTPREEVAILYSEQDAADAIHLFTTEFLKS